MANLESEIVKRVIQRVSTIQIVGFFRIYERICILLEEDKEEC